MVIDIQTGEILENGTDNEPIILADVTSSGKERPWNQKKQMSLDTADLMEEADIKKKAERMRTCAETLVFNKTEEGLKLNQTYFCKCRLCPMCNWRRSMKLSVQNRKVVEEANRRKKLRWIFLTLTVANCKGDKLRDTIKDMSQAFNRLTKYKRVNEQTVGWFRALEITKNNKDNTYHPHYHVLICVEPRYFVTKGRYIKQSEWTELWQKALNVDYKPIVHIEAVKPRKTKKSIEEVLRETEQEINDARALEKAVLETSKYTVKDTDLLKGTKAQNIETVYHLDNAIERKRLVAYGGELKKIHKALNLADGEEENLINIDEKLDEVSAEIQKVTAKWNIGLNKYVLI